MTHTLDATSEPESLLNGAARVDHRVVIVGGGVSGLGMAIRLKQAGIDDFVLLEREPEIGGTWYVNTYPGCQCDIQSHLYSFSFAQNPEWSHVYASQPEIWSYLKGTAERFAIYDHVRFETNLTGAAWDEDAHLWRIETDRGSMTARVFIAAPGGMSAPLIPEVRGLGDFEGDVFHTARWRHDVDLTGKRVAVVGTGASAVQVVPEVQEIAERVVVFQRTPGWVYPQFNRPLTKVERWLYRRFPQLQRLVREGIYWAREMPVPSILKWPRLTRMGGAISSMHLRRQVADRDLRARLRPNYRFGCKRILLSNRWYPTLQQPNVDLVFDGLEEVRRDGVVTPEGVEEVDAIVFATGFSFTDPPLARQVTGCAGTTLADVWQGTPRAYRGASIAGFPNLLWIGGPNTGHSHTSILYMYEAQMTYAIKALRAMAERGVSRVEVRADAQQAYNERLQARLPRTVWNSGGCSSWYLDANGCNSTMWPYFTWLFRHETRHFDPDSYELSALERAPEAVGAGEAAA